MEAEITYTRDTGEKLVNETFGPNNIRRRTSGAEEPHRVDIANGREARELALDKNGFVLVEHRTAVRDFFDVEELKRVYYPEVEALVRRIAGSTSRRCSATRRSSSRSTIRRRTAGRGSRRTLPSRIPPPRPARRRGKASRRARSHFFKRTLKPAVSDSGAGGLGLACVDAQRIEQVGRSAECSGHDGGVPRSAGRGERLRQQ